MPVQLVELTHGGGWRELNDISHMMKFLVFLSVLQLIATVVLINVVLAHTVK